MSARILITRPRGEAEKFAKEIEKEGFSALIAPMLEVVETPFALPDMGPYQGIILTSMHAARAVSVTKMQRDLPVFVVGAATEEILKNQNFTDVSSAGANAAALARLIAVTVADRTKPLLYIRGADISFPMRETLAAEGFQVDELIVYSAEKKEDFSEEVKAAMRQGAIDAVVFFSRRTAENFMALAQKNGLLPALARIKSLSISPAVLECVRNYTWAGTYSAARPDGAGMVNLIRSIAGEQTMNNSENTVIENAEEIIQRFGGIRPMAGKTSIPVTTIQGWKKRNAIPEARRSEILEAAQQHNIDISDLVQKAANANENTNEIGSENNQPSARRARDVAGSAQKPEENPEQKDEAKTPENIYNNKNAPKSGRGDIPADLAQILAETEMRAIAKSTLINIVLVVVGLAAAAVLLMPRLDQRDTLPPLNNQAEERLGALEDEMGSMREEQSSLSALIPEDLNEKLAAIQQGAGAAYEQAQEMSSDVLGANAGSLEQRIANLEAHMVRIAESPMAASLIERFQNMAASASGEQQLGQSVADISALLSGKPEDVNAALDQAREENPALAQTFEGVPASDLEAAALILGMTQFRSSLNRDNQPFADDMQVLMALVGEDNTELRASLEKLAPYGESGVLTPGGLSTELKSMTGDIVVASLKGEDVSITDRAKAKFNELFQVEKDGELVTGTPTQATLSKTQSLLDEGDLEGAIANMQTLQGPAAQSAQPWIDQAQATLMAQNFKQLLAQTLNARARGGLPLTASGGGVGGTELIHDEETGIHFLRQTNKMPTGMKKLKLP